MARQDTVLVVCGMAFEAAIAGGPGVVAMHGARRAAERLDELLARHARHCRGILSFGIAGGLDPALRPGACVLGRAVVSEWQQVPADARWLRALQCSLPGAVVGTLAGATAPLVTARSKSVLWQGSGACAVDMESHLAALAAARHGLPFAALRIVADPAQRSLPACALAAYLEDGRTAMGPLLRALALRPGELPALLAVAADALAARRSLRAARAGAGALFGAP